MSDDNSPFTQIELNDHSPALIPGAPIPPREDADQDTERVAPQTPSPSRV